MAQVSMESPLRGSTQVPDTPSPLKLAMFLFFVVFIVILTAVSFFWTATLPDEQRYGVDPDKEVNDDIEIEGDLNMHLIPEEWRTEEGELLERSAVAMKRDDLVTVKAQGGGNGAGARPEGQGGIVMPEPIGRSVAITTATEILEIDQRQAKQRKLDGSR